MERRRQGDAWSGNGVRESGMASSGSSTSNGSMFIIYNHQRYTLNRAGKRGVGSVQIAVFREEDVRAGKPVTDKVRLHQIATQLQDTDDTSGASGK